LIGDEIVFTITASNEGSIDATNVEILEILPTGYQYVSSITSSGVYDEVTGVWSIPSVKSQGAETLTITVEVLDIDDYVNTVSLEALDQIDRNSNNDTSSDYIELTDDCLVIYNKFSPNGNGENEFFTIDCISNYSKNKLEIYNRWGNIVYSKDVYDNSFDGTSNGRAVLDKDRKLPAGTYYYVLDLGDGSEARVGWLYLAR